MNDDRFHRVLLKDRSIKNDIHGTLYILHGTKAPLKQFETRGKEDALFRPDQKKYFQELYFQV